MRPGACSPPLPRMENPLHPPALPIQGKERFIILDALRGLALFGICLANFPEFSLYSFLPASAASSMPTSGIDTLIRYLQYIFIDGKFYTIFSILFGIGFSIIINKAQAGVTGSLRIFYRRMSILLIIGGIHLMFIWSGDILMLYALLGMVLPVFRNVSDRKLLAGAGVLLSLPILLDALKVATGIEPSAAVIRMQQYYCARFGITTDNFAYWLRDSESFTEVFQFLLQGAFVRMQEFIDGNRLFKVLGLFLIGFVIGRNQLYAKLEENTSILRRISLSGSLIGLPASVLYAWSAMHEAPWGLVAHSSLYAVSIFPLGLAYMSGFSLLYLHHRNNSCFRCLAAPGRMALCNYIGQSLFGIIIFYGIGFGWGADTGLVYVTLIATGVYLVEILLSKLWFQHFQFGPLEWIWRMFTYGKRLPILLNSQEHHP